MSIRHAQPRHRAEPVRGNTMGTLSKAVSPRVGSIGRTTAVAAAAAGLALGLAAPGQAAAPVAPSSDTAPASAVSVPTSNTYNSTRASVTSTPAPRTATHRAPSPRTTAGSTGTQTRTNPTTNTTRTATNTRQAPAAARTGTSVRTAAETITPRPANTPAPAASKPSAAEDTSVQTASSTKPAKSGGIASTALAFEGAGYKYAGETPGAWDCSGFVKYVYGQAGVELPHNTTAIRKSEKMVPTSNPSPGDLVYQNGGSHVGIYIGDGKMIGAQNPTSGTVIREADSVYGPLMGYYTLAS